MSTTLRLLTTFFRMTAVNLLEWALKCVKVASYFYLINENNSNNRMGRMRQIGQKVWKL